MADELYFECLFRAAIHGDDFSPKKLAALSSLPLENSVEKGETVYRKSHAFVYESGVADICFSYRSPSDQNYPFDTLLDLLLENLNAIHACGGTSIVIWVIITRSIQGNWEVSAAQIQKIAKLNASLAITYCIE